MVMNCGYAVTSGLPYLVRSCIWGWIETADVSAGSRAEPISLGNDGEGLENQDNEETR